MDSKWKEAQGQFYQSFSEDPPGRRRIDKRREKSYDIEAGTEDRYMVDKEPPGREGGFREE